MIFLLIFNVYGKEMSRQVRAQPLLITFDMGRRFESFRDGLSDHQTRSGYHAKELSPGPGVSPELLQLY